MLRRIFIGFSLLFCAKNFAQDVSYYLPYQMPTHTAVKFHTFVTNPALPLLGFQEQNVGLYYRTQWLGYKNENFALMGASYGINWNETSSVNALVYKRNVGILSNTGVVLNYGHQVQFSDDVGLRLGLNVIPTYTAIDQSRIVLHKPNDPFLDARSTFGITAQPGFDMNIGGVHFGVTAENAFDYSVANTKMMTSFEDKSFTGHLMYRALMDSNSEIFENGSWSAMARVTKEGKEINLSANVFFDMPKLGWTYVGYTQKYGIFAGLGFNINDYLSIGFEYEKDIASKIPNLGNTFGVYTNFQFGGDRQRTSALLRQKQKQRRQKAREKAEQRLKNRIEKSQIPKVEPKPEPVAQPPKPEPAPSEPTQATAQPTPSVVEPPRGPDTALPGTDIRVRKDNIASDKIPAGYYVVVGVYSDPRNAFRFIQELRKKYELAGFLHPLNNRSYVYLSGAGLSAEEAVNVYNKNLLNNDFVSGIWILQVGQ